MITYTKRDEDVYNYIITYTKENIRPPTIREICDGMGIKSTSTVFARIQKLKRLGFINLDDKGKIVVKGLHIVSGCENCPLRNGNYR